MSGSVITGFKSQKSVGLAAYLYYISVSLYKYYDLSDEN